MHEGLRHRAENEGGFTLVELLVVMLIIGLLATIAVPAFFSQRTKAHDASAKQMAGTARTAIEVYAIDNGSYAGAKVANLRAIEPTLPTKLSVKGPGGTGVPTSTGYRVTVTSSSKTKFSIDRNGDTITFPCQPAKACSGGGWN